MQIRSFESGDKLSVMKILLKAFGRTEESRLVDSLRLSDLPLIELVALEDGVIHGYILFSPLSGNGTVRLCGLGPMAVLPEHQRKGIGSQLIHAGIQLCVEQQYDGVLVLGHAEYYPRFGFVPASRFGIITQFEAPDEVLLFKELVPGRIGKPVGFVEYHHAFDEVE